MAFKDLLPLLSACLGFLQITMEQKRIFKLSPYFVEVLSFSFNSFLRDQNEKVGLYLGSYCDNYLQNLPPSKLFFSRLNDC